MVTFSELGWSSGFTSYFFALAVSVRAAGLLVEVKGPGDVHRVHVLPAGLHLRVQHVALHLLDGDSTQQPFVHQHLQL